MKWLDAFVAYIQKKPDAAAWRIACCAMLLAPWALRRQSMLGMLAAICTFATILGIGQNFDHRYQKRWGVKLGENNDVWGPRQWMLWWSMLAQRIGVASLGGLFFAFAFGYQIIGMILAAISY